ncbi:2842_t:CDS:2 [Entrophospora sp. SA101]|nr:2842_t:CDS:2 [Entrophospora sp. SA101]
MDFWSAKCLLDENKKSIGQSKSKDNGNKHRQVEKIKPKKTP